MKFFKKPLALITVVLLSISMLTANGFAEPSLSYDSSVKSSLLSNYTTDWLGTSFDWTGKNNPTNENSNWGNNSINSMCVTSDGSVVTNSGWDETLHETSIYKDGKRIGSVAGTHYGGASGEAVATNGTYIWVSLKITGSDAVTMTGAGVKKASIDGKITYPMLIHATSTPGLIVGLASFGDNLYVADSINNKIYVYGVEDNAKKPTEIAVSAPDQITTDESGNIWVIAENKYIKKFSPAGALLETLNLASNIVPAGLDIYSGKLYLADNGVGQNIKIYDITNLTAAPTTFGVDKGVYAGPVPGRLGEKRFYTLTGVGLDAAGNIYVAMGTSTTGCSIDAYSTSGNRLWEMYSTQFLDTGDLDPATDSGVGDTSFDVYTKSEVFIKDTTSVSGKGWEYKAFTLDPLKYPDDIRINGNDEYGIVTPWIRYINGKKFMFLTDMYTTNLSVFRFEANSEIAIPCAIIAKQPKRVGNIWWTDNVPKTGAEWIWVDANGDGKIDVAEVTSNSFTPQSSGWCVDNNGTVWQPQSSGSIRKFNLVGLTSSNGLNYTFANVTSENAPSLGTESFSQLMRAEYDVATDDMILTGYTPSNPNNKGYWKVIGRTIVRFSNWTKATRKLEWRVDLDMNKEYACYAASIAVAGDYVFIGYRNDGRVEIYNKSNGSVVGYMLPGAEIGGLIEGWLDIAHALVARKMADGSYAVFCEEMWWGSVLMYKWNGDSAVTTRPANPQPYKFECLKLATSTTITVDGNLNDTQWGRAMNNTNEKGTWC